ncbi:sensor histidine kinase [Chondrinema litorale]|uniref:sensor histidine kinase n=1 Tax=Chondrinema litorale TaxID=2994555 RepID=UPI002543237C|nr:histidine kinase [Chondrinema litorale]UZR98363.1 histidine kinase [Chondrinema litorale]
MLKNNFIAAARNNELQQHVFESKFKLKEQELNLLKSQIHPHFLFNTLNTIYGFALKQSTETPDLILRLSDLLDYILYQVNKPGVSLRDELKHLNQYIDLEKVRFEDTLSVRMKLDIENDEEQIAPLILLPFVENAFKHGALTDGLLLIDIVISSTNSRLHFYVKNTCNFISYNAGIGLSNIQKRLELLYPDRHDLNISMEEDAFIVNLEIYY